MKIDRRNPLHWWCLAVSGLWVLLAIAVRPVIRMFTRRRRVLLYGHKLGGNLLALYRHLRTNHRHEFEVAFLTLDSGYHRELSAKSEAVVLATSPRALAWLASADALVSDHGLHALQPLLYFSNLRFFDVWHGIPFKGFDRDDFRVQHRYDEIWVASESQRDLYVERFGFRPESVRATGYARTDCLVKRSIDIDAMKKGLGIDPATCGKLILFAPTWQQDDRDRNLFPFGLQAETFLHGLSQAAEEASATILLRQHLNSGLGVSTGMRRIVHVPYARFPDTEAILLASDILICDWSSIAFDFLLLDRPAFFLDVPAPFRKGFSLGPEFRYGTVVGDLPELLARLAEALVEPRLYWEVNRMRHAKVRQDVYGSCADGCAAERCAERLSTIIRGSSQ